jgi:energy-coupling factor transporter ATP-binding protein EcfA2
MKQRVGIARALSMEPKVLLMDEPFGALDALTRAKLQDELLQIVAKTHSTVVMVTHDVDEAVLLSDRIVMLTNGPAATIGEILAVDLPRPRDRIELAGRPSYVALPQGRHRLPLHAAVARREDSRPDRAKNQEKQKGSPPWPPQSSPLIRALRAPPLAPRVPCAAPRCARASRSASTARSSSRWRSSCCSTWASWC